MKKSLGLLFVLSLAAGCARYETAALCSFPAEEIHECQGVSIAARAFTRAQCKHYLDRDVIRQGYQPVQIYIENLSDSAFFFSPNWLTLPAAPPEEVSKKVHSSTLGRVAGYGAAALLASPLFAIPAVVDGFKSAEANANLDQDFLVKAARDCIIPPRSHVNMVLFIPKEAYEETFTVTLVNEITQKPLKITASAR